jgi:hypothetical protein
MLLVLLVAVALGLPAIIRTIRLARSQPEFRVSDAANDEI